MTNTLSIISITHRNIINLILSIAILSGSLSGSLIGALSASASSASTVNQISIIAGKSVITKGQISARLELFKAMQNISGLTREQEAMFSKIAAQSLIDEALMLHELKTSQKTTISDQEVDKFIEQVERSRNLPKNFFRANFGKSRSMYNSFLAKMRGEIAKSRIVNSFMPNIDVTDSDVNELALRYGHKDANYEIRKFVTQDNSEASFKNLNQVQILYPTCSKKYKGGNKISETDINTSLSKLSLDERKLILGLGTGDFSAIIEQNDHFVTYQICSRKVLGVSTEEFDNITNIIGNKLVGLKFMKYLEGLRTKAYIKYLN